MRSRHPESNRPNSQDLSYNRGASRREKVKAHGQRHDSNKLSIHKETNNTDKTDTHLYMLYMLSPSDTHVLFIRTTH